MRQTTDYSRPVLEGTGSCPEYSQKYG